MNKQIPGRLQPIIEKIESTINRLEERKKVELPAEKKKIELAIDQLKMLKNSLLETKPEEVDSVLLTMLKILEGISKGKNS